MPIPTTSKTPIMDLLSSLKGFDNHAVAQPFASTIPMAMEQSLQMSKSLSYSVLRRNLDEKVEKVLECLAEAKKMNLKAIQEAAKEAGIKKSDSRSKSYQCSTPIENSNSQHNQWRQGTHDMEFNVRTGKDLNCIVSGEDCTVLVKVRYSSGTSINGAVNHETEWLGRPAVEKMLKMIKASEDMENKLGTLLSGTM